MSPSETVGEGDLPFLISSLDGDSTFAALCRFSPHSGIRRSGRRTSPRTSNPDALLGAFEFVVLVFRPAGKPSKE